MMTQSSTSVQAHRGETTLTQKKGDCTNAAGWSILWPHASQEVLPVSPEEVVKLSSLLLSLAMDDMIEVSDWTKNSQQ